MSFDPLPGPPPIQDTPVSSDFQDRVLTRIRKRNTRISQLRLTTTFTLLILSTVFLGRQLGEIRTRWGAPPSDRELSAARGVDWLLRTQQSEGHWNAAGTGGHERFSPGVTALATLALLRAPEPVPKEALHKALEQIETSVEKRSMFSLNGPEFYNRILELHTLVEAEKIRPDPQRRALLRHAFADLLTRQGPQGGWGYTASAPFAYQDTPPSNSAVTWWISRLLQQGDFLRVPGARSAGQQADLWLSDRFSDPLQPEYRQGMAREEGLEHALGWMAVMTQMPTGRVQDTSPSSEDAYRDFIRSQVTQEASRLRALSGKQRTDGSWLEPEDRWYRAGGQVYLTALSVLSQVPRGI